MRTRAWRTARAALRRVGFDLIPSGDVRLHYVKRLELLDERRIGLVLDAGANTGQYARRLRADGYRGRVVSFEPLAEAFAELERRAHGEVWWRCHRLALGDVDGEALLHVSGNRLSSSLLAMAEAHRSAAPESEVVGREAVPIARLDSLRTGLLAGGDPAFLKLDVQGLELSVLDGAQETHRQLEALECELSLVELYEGQALLPELLARLDEEGFDLVSLEPAFREPVSGRLLQLEGLFARRP